MSWLIFKVKFANDRPDTPSPQHHGGSGAQPSVTKSMTTALADLDLRHLFVIHAGTASFPLTTKISAVAFPQLTTNLQLD